MDAKCRQLTASWVRERAKADEGIELCEFFEGHERAGSEALLPAGMSVRVGSILSRTWVDQGLILATGWLGLLPHSFSLLSPLQMSTHCRI